MTRRWTNKSYGTVTQEVQGNATAWMWERLKKGLAAQREVDQAERLAQRGTLDKMWPSATDAGKCERAVGYSLMNVEETNPPDHRSLLNFAYGHAAEEMLAPVLEAAGFQLHREVYFRIGDEPKCVTGRVDFIGVDPAEHALIELKTTSSLSMKLTLEGMKRGERQESHEGYLTQVMLYLHASQLGCLMAGDQVLPPMPHGYLTYCIKDTKKGQEPIQAFRVDYDEQAAAGHVARLLEIQDRAATGIIKNIPQEFIDHYAAKGKHHWRCSYCSFFGHDKDEIERLAAEQKRGAA